MRTRSIIIVILALSLVSLTTADTHGKKDDKKGHGSKKTEVKKKEETKSKGNDDTKLDDQRRLLQSMLSKMPFVPMIPIALLMGDKNTNFLEGSNFKGGILPSSSSDKQGHSTDEKLSNEALRRKNYADKTTRTSVKTSGYEDSLGDKMEYQTVDPGQVSSFVQDNLDDDEGDDDEDDDEEPMEENQGPQNPSTLPPLKTINDRVNKGRSDAPYTTDTNGAGFVCKTPCPMACAPTCSAYCCARSIYRTFFWSPFPSSAVSPYVSNPAQGIRQYQQPDASQQTGVTRAISSAYTNYQRSYPPPQIQAAPAPVPAYVAPRTVANARPFPINVKPFRAPAPAAAAAVAAAAVPRPLAAAAFPAYAPSPVVPKLPYPHIPAASYLPARPLPRFVDRAQIPVDKPNRIEAAYPGIIETYAGQQQKPTFCPASCMKQCTQYCQPQCCSIMKRDEIGGKSQLIHLRDLVQRLKTTLTTKKDVLESISKRVSQGAAAPPNVQKSIPADQSKQLLSGGQPAKVLQANPRANLAVNQPLSPQ